MARVAPIILAVAVWIYGVIDCIQTPEHRVPKGLKKPVWLLIILLVPVIGALAWLGVKWVAWSGPGGSSGDYRRPRRKGPTAPDDDPEFLANLDWQARKAHYERQKREREAHEAAENAGSTGAAGAAGSTGAAGASGAASASSASTASGESEDSPKKAEDPAPSEQTVDWDRLAEELGEDPDEPGHAGV